MNRVLVPVRYPLSDSSRRTLKRAVEIATERGADLTVLHVDLHQEPGSVTRTELRRAVVAELGHLSRARYVVRKGFLVEEAILDEVANEDADAVVIGRRQHGRFRRMLKRVFEGPDVADFLGQHLDCEVIVV